MAACYCSPTFLPLSFRRLDDNSFPLPLPKFSSTRDEAIQSRICASSNKPRISRRVKNNNELVRDIRDFLSSVGLPHDHVPSMKVLSQHGRQDLAHKVRRRGYKFIAELLDTSTEALRDIATTDYSQNERLGILTGLGSSGEINRNASAQKDKNLKLKDQIYFSSPAVEQAVPKFMDHGELDAPDELACEENGARETKNLFSGLHKINGNGSFEHDILENVSSCEVGCTQSTERDFGNKDLDVEAVVDLHQKELELTDLNWQIEQEKVVLSALQVEVKTAITNAQELVAQKEIELLDVEENLTGLVETIVQFSVEGDVVELAGSFNGWCNKINLEPEPTPAWMRRVWRTVLWLYPGVYEIKFVVDGNWTTDPDRELVSRSNIQNNLLRIY